MAYTTAATTKGGRNGRAVLENNVTMELRRGGHDNRHGFTFGGVPFGNIFGGCLRADRIDQLVRFGVCRVQTRLDDTNVVCSARENGDDRYFPVREIVVREDWETMVAPGDSRVGVGHGE